MESWREELYSNLSYSNYLAHYNIKNSHWGVRRYQNPDGSLTPAGRKRYGVGPPREDKGDFEETRFARGKNRDSVSYMGFSQKGRELYEKDRKKMLKLIDKEISKEEAEEARRFAKDMENLPFDEDFGQWDPASVVKDIDRNLPEATKKALEDDDRKQLEQYREEEKAKNTDNNESKDSSKSDGVKPYTPEEDGLDEVKKGPKAKSEGGSKDKSKDEGPKEKTTKDYKELRGRNEAELAYLKSEKQLKSYKEDDRDYEALYKGYKEGASNLSSAGGYFKNAGEYANTTVKNGREFQNNQTWTRKSKRQLNRMSDEDFNKLLKRMDLERQYSALTANDVLEGRHKTSQLLYDVGSVVAVAAGVAGVAASIYSIKNGRR